MIFHKITRTIHTAAAIPAIDAKRAPASVYLVFFTFTEEKYTLMQ